MKEVLQIAYLRHLQDFYLFESVKDGFIEHVVNYFFIVARSAYDFITALLISRFGDAFSDIKSS